MIQRIALILILIGTVTSKTFAGGGWPQPRGNGYFKLSQSYLLSAQYYDGLGNIIELTPSYGFFSTSLYGEYGFTDRLTGIIYLPFFARALKNELQYNQSGIREEGDALNSFGDTDISIKYGLIVNKPIVVSASITLGLPLGNNGGGNASALQTGDGEFNQMLRIDASHSFHPKPIYVSAYAAFNNRTKGFSDEVRFGAEVGVTLKKIIPILKLNVVKSLFNGDLTNAENGSSIFSNNTEYVSPTIELNYQLTDKVGVSGSGGFAIAGKNILASPNWALGVYLKL